MERELWITPGDRAASARRFLDEVARDFGLVGRGREDALMAAHEAIANALEWGSPCQKGSAHLRVAREGEIVAFYVRDCGTFHDERALRMEMPPLLAERGRGLALIAALMDQVEILREPRKTTVRMTKRPEPSALGTGAVAATQASS